MRAVCSIGIFVFRYCIVTEARNIVENLDTQSWKWRTGNLRTGIGTWNREFKTPVYRPKHMYISHCNANGSVPFNTRDVMTMN